MESNYKLTMDNCRDAIRKSPSVKKAWEIVYSTGYGGFEYELLDGMIVKLRVESGLGYLILQLYPGIIVRGPMMGMVTEYCQKVSLCPGMGYLAVDGDDHSVYYHSETCFKDNAVTGEVLEMMQKAAVAFVEKHLESLKAFAYGRLPNLNNLIGAMKSPTGHYAKSLDDKEQELLEMNRKNIFDALKQEGHNVIAENMNPNSPIPYCMETLSRDDRFRQYIYITAAGWMFRTVRLELRCEEAYRTQLAEYCNRVNNENIIGFLKIGEDGYPYCTMASYLLGGDNPISRETLSSMCNRALRFFLFIKENLQCLGHGILPRDYGRHADMIKVFPQGAERRSLRRVREAETPHYNSHDHNKQNEMSGFDEKLPASDSVDEFLKWFQDLEERTRAFDECNDDVEDFGDEEDFDYEEDDDCEEDDD